MTTNYTNAHESPGMPAPRAAWLGKGEGVACRANSPASSLASALPGCAGQAFRPGEGVNAPIQLVVGGRSGSTQNSHNRAKPNLVVNYFDKVLSRAHGHSGDRCGSRPIRTSSRVGRNAVTGEAGMVKAGAAACELARNGTHAPLPSTRKRGRHSGGFVQIRGIRGLLSSSWFSLSNGEDRKVRHADS